MLGNCGPNAAIIEPRSCVVTQEKCKLVWCQNRVLLMRQDYYKQKVTMQRLKLKRRIEGRSRISPAESMISEEHIQVYDLG